MNKGFTRSWSHSLVHTSVLETPKVIEGHQESSFYKDLLILWEKHTLGMSRLIGTQELSWTKVERGCASCIEMQSGGRSFLSVLILGVLTSMTHPLSLSLWGPPELTHQAIPQDQAPSFLLPDLIWGLLCYWRNGRTRSVLGAHGGTARGITQAPTSAVSLKGQGHWGTRDQCLVFIQFTQRVWLREALGPLKELELACSVQPARPQRGLQSNGGRWLWCPGEWAHRVVWGSHSSRLGWS